MKFPSLPAFLCPQSAGLGARAVPPFRRRAQFAHILCLAVVALASSPAIAAPPAHSTEAKSAQVPSGTRQDAPVAQRGESGHDAEPSETPQLDGDLSAESFLSRLRAMDAARRRQRRHMLHNSRFGSVGGLQTVDAGSGADGAFRAHIDFNLYRGSSWLTPGEDEYWDAGVLSLSWTPADSPIELFASMRRWNLNGLSLPSDFQVIGDTWIGVKWFQPIFPWITVGLDASLGIPFNTFVSTKRTIEATSFGIRANLSADLRDLPAPHAIPLLIRLNLGYVFDNSWALVRGLERDRYNALSTEGDEARLPIGEELRHRLSRRERLGLQLDRTDRFTMALGFEMPFLIDRTDVVISPIVEWLVDVPVNRQRLSCTSGSSPIGVDPCLSETGASAYRQRLLMGIRVIPGLRNLALYTAVEVGLSGVHNHAQELFPQMPWTMHFGMSYAYDYAK